MKSFTPHDRAALPPALCAILLLTTRFTELDACVSGYFYDTALATFPLRHNWVTETVLHDLARDATIAIALLIVFLLAVNLSLDQCIKRRRALMFSLTSMVITTAVVATIKHSSNIHCPYDLVEYGGRYSRVLPGDAFLAHIESPGHCWPSGHASTGFSLFALFFAARWLGSRWAPLLFWLAATAGIVCTLAQTARGAHFISHGLWTGLIIWTGNLLLARVLLKPLENES